MIESYSKWTDPIVGNDEHIDNIHWFSEASSDEDTSWDHQKKKGKIKSGISRLILPNNGKYGQGYLTPRANQEANEGQWQSACKHDDIKG